MNELTEIQANVQMNMDDVVSVFLSKYEDQLYAKRTECQNELKKQEKVLKDFSDSLVTNLDTSAYEFTNEVVGVKCRVSGSSLEKEKNNLYIGIKLNVDSLDTTCYRGSFMNYKRIEVNEGDTVRYFELKEQIELLRSELTEVMLKIKQIGRKERQIRGKISEQKLKETGLSSLLENQEMLQLVQLD